MKKKLEADLISIAHRILQLKNKSDINQLYLETQKLYEKLSVLRFVEEHFSEAKPTIGVQEISKEIESVFDKSEAIEPVSAAIIEEAVVEKTAETTMEEANPLAEPEPIIIEEETAVETEEMATEEIPLQEIVLEETIPEEVIATSLEQTEEILNESNKEEEQEIVVESKIVLQKRKKRMKHRNLKRLLNLLLNCPKKKKCKLSWKYQRKRKPSKSLLKIY